MLKKKIYDEQIQALKNRDREKLSILRYILAQIKNKEIDKKPTSPAGKSELINEEVIFVLRKISKELNESIEASKKGGRDDLISEYQKQLQVVSSYLPKEISDEELKKEVEKIIDKNKELSEKNPPAGGQVQKAIIGICVKELKSKADPARIVRILHSLSNTTSLSNTSD